MFRMFEECYCGVVWNIFEVVCDIENATMAL